MFARFIVSIAFSIFPAFTFSAVTPACPMPFPRLLQETYDTTGYNSSPNNAAEFQSLISNYANGSNFFGSGTIGNINGGGNPHGTNENYLNIISGYISIDTAGTYQFAVDGDDAVEVLINGAVVSHYYGLHAESGAPVDPASIVLDVGYHDIEYHHHERTGLDSYDLYWQKPGDSSFSIVPSSVFSSCTPAIYEIGVTPSCSIPENGVWMSVYNKTGYGHPNNSSDYQTLVNNYAIPSLLCGEDAVAKIDSATNGIGLTAQNNNPFTCSGSPNSQENYLAIFTGYINVPTDGFYDFGINGDDAIELIINGNVVTGWYGGHGFYSGGSQPNPTYNVSVPLAAGYHELEFRMEELGGGDSYFLFWRKPTDASYTIMASTDASELVHCPPKVELFLKKTTEVESDPVNGTTNPKSVPGAIMIYTLEIVNSGNLSPDADSLFISDPIPSHLKLFVDNYDGLGKSVKFIDVNSSGLTLNASGITYSSTNNVQCTDNYSAVSSGGYDENINYICIEPSGQMNFDYSSPPEFHLEFQTQMK